MNDSLNIGIIGDYDPASPFHVATDVALHHAAAALSTAVQVEWLPTAMLLGEAGETVLTGYDALWCAPGSPYQSMQGALHAIRYARVAGRPFIGT